MGNGALATVEQKSGGIMDMTGTTGDIAARLADMGNKLDLVKTFFKTQMIKDIDYGIIPGTDKPALYKPGAEKLCALYGFSQRVLSKVETRDLATGYYLSEVTVQLTHAASGIVVADGVGECSSYESKYRYRWVFESDIPKNIDKAGLVGKTFESKRSGKEYTRYRLENPDLIDQWNTVLKMAKKRALVDATLAATRTSGMFCQTEGELDAWLDSDEIPKQERLEKQKAAPKASDEKHHGNPSAAIDPTFTMRGETKKLSEWDTAALTWIAYKSQARDAVKAAAQAILNSRAQSSNTPNETKNDFQGEEAPPPTDDDAPSGFVGDKS